MSITTDFAPGTEPKRSEWSPQFCRLLVLAGVAAFWSCVALAVQALT